MWFEFFRFDLRYQLQQPLLWISGFFLGLIAFALTSSDAVQLGGAIGNIHRNAPMVIAQFLGLFSLLAMFVVPVFIAGTVIRDTEFNVADLIFATPMKKRDYLVGRFTAGLTACISIFVVISIAMVLGSLMPWVDQARLGAFSIWPYVWGFAVFVLPNLLIMGAFLMLLASVTRSMLMVYAGVFAFNIFFSLAGVFTKDIGNEWVAVLLDPFGISAFARMVRYYTAAEANTRLPEMASFLLANRVLWVTVALVLLAATLAFFKPQRGGTRSMRKWGKQPAAEAVGDVPKDMTFLRVEPAVGRSVAWKQCWQIFKFDLRGVLRSVPFLVILLFAIFSFVSAATQADSMFGTEVYPVTRVMMNIVTGAFNFMLIMVVIFYSGELVFKERQARTADISDTMPVADWVPLAAKGGVLVGVSAIFLLVGVCTAMAFQVYKGGVPLEPLLYLQAKLYAGRIFVTLAATAIVVQVIANNKFLGYFIVVFLLIVQMVCGAFHFEHHLYAFPGEPGLPYSDMNGYGHYLAGWAWYALYWAWFVAAAMIVAQAFYVRGLSDEITLRLRTARHRLKGAAGIALVASIVGFGATAGWIIYSTTVVNEYVTGDVRMDRQADLEKLYRKYKDAPQPKITDIQANVDIFPLERKLAINGRYRLMNKLARPLDMLYVMTNEDKDVQTSFDNLPAHKDILNDKRLGFRVIKLDQSLAPGATLDLDFRVDVQHKGYTNSGAPEKLNYNGTFFNNSDFFPHFGYYAGAELQDRNERRKRGLGEPERMAKLENEAARANHSIGGWEADWVSFDTTISTSADQIALAPGYLQRTWEKDGRKYFHYKMDRPMLPFFAYLSARWEVRKGDWHGMPIEIYFDKKHPYNVDRMIEATQKSLDYFTTNFTPYQHKQVRILEFPNYQQFAQSFANTVPYSEGIGFIADLRNKDNIDYVFYVTAHEIAHQWWAHQVIGANVQGAAMLSESLAQYSALMVMEKAYGREKMRRFLKYELDSYLRQRGGERIEELPLYRVESQPYIYYNKGSVIFYRLRDEIGEAPLNRALKRFLEDKAYRSAPYPTSSDLLAYIRAEAAPDKQALITDMFEKIVLYDNRVVDATAKKRTDGLWDVTMKLHIAKIETDGQGKESPRPYDEPVEIAVFARAKGAKEADERVLFSEKRRLAGSDPVVTVTVKELPFDVAVDPYNKLIDRVSTDNRKQVSVE